MDKAPVSTSDHEYYLKLIEELNIKYEKMQEWYDAALDWREFELSKAEKRIQALEASLLDVKNQHESKCKECQAWHDGALDWRESEIAKAVKAERTK